MLKINGKNLNAYSEPPIILKRNLCNRRYKAGTEAYSYGPRKVENGCLIISNANPASSAHNDLSCKKYDVLNKIP